MSSRNSNLVSVKASKPKTSKPRPKTYVYPSLFEYLSKNNAHLVTLLQAENLKLEQTKDYHFNEIFSRYAFEYIRRMTIKQYNLSLDKNIKTSTADSARCLAAKAADKAFKVAINDLVREHEHAIVDLQTNRKKIVADYKSKLDDCLQYDVSAMVKKSVSVTLSEGFSSVQKKLFTTYISMQTQHASFTAETDYNKLYTAYCGEVRPVQVKLFNKIDYGLLQKKNLFDIYGKNIISAAKLNALPMPAAKSSQWKSVYVDNSGKTIDNVYICCKYNHFTRFDKKDPRDLSCELCELTLLYPTLVAQSDYYVKGGISVFNCPRGHCCGNSIQSHSECLQCRTEDLLKIHNHNVHCVSKLIASPHEPIKTQCECNRVYIITYSQLVNDISNGVLAKTDEHNPVSTRGADIYSCMHRHIPDTISGTAAAHYSVEINAGHTFNDHLEVKIGSDWVFLNPLYKYCADLNTAYGCNDRSAINCKYLNVDKNEISKINNTVMKFIIDNKIVDVNMPKLKKLFDEAFYQINI